MGARRIGAVAVVAVLVACSNALAQLPAVPGAPALPGGPVPPAAPGAVPVAAPAAAPAAPRNIWSFFMKTPEQKAQCRAHLCSSRIGLFVNNLLVPAGAATGGLLGPICPPPGIGVPGGAGAPNPADLLKPATSPEGAAARIKAEEAQAKAKVAAIEYLATVDCRYYPEAEAGLIAGLRAEKNECVRIAAAKALVTGCCCSPKVIKALLTVVNCSNKDGFPAEASEVVRAYAFVALERCLRKCVEGEAEAPPEPPPAAKQAMYETLSPSGVTADYSSHVLLASYYPAETKGGRAELIEEARQALARGLKLSRPAVTRLSGPKNVADAVFPEESRPKVSLASILSLSIPSMPSFAAIRSAPRQAEDLSWVPPLPPQIAVNPAAYPQPTGYSQPAGQIKPVAARPADGLSWVPPLPPQMRGQPDRHASISAAPVIMPAPQPERRGDLLNIVKEGWRR